MHASPEGVVDVDVFVMLQLYIADELSAGLCTHRWSARELMHMPPERVFGHVAGVSRACHSRSWPEPSDSSARCELADSRWLALQVNNIDLFRHQRFAACGWRNLRLIRGK